MLSLEWAYSKLPPLVGGGGAGAATPQQGAKVATAVLQSASEQSQVAVVAVSYPHTHKVHIFQGPVIVCVLELPSDLVGWCWIDDEALVDGVGKPAPDQDARLADLHAVFACVDGSVWVQSFNGCAVATPPPTIVNVHRSPYVHIVCEASDADCSKMQSRRLATLDCVSSVRICKTRQPAVAPREGGRKARRPLHHQTALLILSNMFGVGKTAPIHLLLQHFFPEKPNSPAKTAFELDCLSDIREPTTCCGLVEASQCPAQHHHQDSEASMNDADEARSCKCCATLIEGTCSGTLYCRLESGTTSKAAQNQASATAAPTRGCFGPPQKMTWPLQDGESVCCVEILTSPRGCPHIPTVLVVVGSQGSVQVRIVNSATAYSTATLLQQPPDLKPATFHLGLPFPSARVSVMHARVLEVEESIPGGNGQGQHLNHRMLVVCTSFGLFGAFLPNAMHIATRHSSKTMGALPLPCQPLCTAAASDNVIGTHFWVNARRVRGASHEHMIALRALCAMHSGRVASFWFRHKDIVSICRKLQLEFEHHYGTIGSRHVGPADIFQVVSRQSPQQWQPQSHTPKGRNQEQEHQRRIKDIVGEIQAVSTLMTQRQHEHAQVLGQIGYLGACFNLTRALRRSGAISTFGRYFSTRVLQASELVEVALPALPAQLVSSVGEVAGPVAPAPSLQHSTKFVSSVASAPATASGPSHATIEEQRGFQWQLTVTLEKCHARRSIPSRTWTNSFTLPWTAPAVVAEASSWESRRAMGSAIRYEPLNVDHPNGTETSGGSVRWHSVSIPPHLRFTPFNVHTHIVLRYFKAGHKKLSTAIVLSSQRVDGLVAPCPMAGVQAQKPAFASRRYLPTSFGPDMLSRLGLSSGSWNRRDSADRAVPMDGASRPNMQPINRLPSGGFEEALSGGSPSGSASTIDNLQDDYVVDGGVFRLSTSALGSALTRIARERSTQRQASEMDTNLLSRILAAVGTPGLAPQSHHDEGVHPNSSNVHTGSHFLVPRTTYLQCGRSHPGTAAEVGIVEEDTDDVNSQRLRSASAGTSHGSRISSAVRFSLSAPRGPIAWAACHAAMVHAASNALEPEKRKPVSAQGRPERWKIPEDSRQDLEALAFSLRQLHEKFEATRLESVDPYHAQGETCGTFASATRELPSQRLPESTVHGDEMQEKPVTPGFRSGFNPLAPERDEAGRISLVQVAKAVESLRRSTILSYKSLREITANVVHLADS
eukprot:INCI609.1.p1 GENE.INCI609.1~~INCI609.1.p1  ORF type:complete len:1226 (-),score=135.90 INCI609.1:1105-4782(-)